MGTGDGLVGGDGKGVGVVSRDMMAGVGLGLGVGLAAGVGVGPAWEVVTTPIIANIKPASTTVTVFIDLIGVLSWR
jgi:hypothetical protein